MLPQTRRLAAILLIVYPTVVYGGFAASTRLMAGSRPTGVLLILSVVLLRYVDEARLSPAWKAFTRSSTPAAAVLTPAPTQHGAADS